MISTAYMATGSRCVILKRNTSLFATAATTALVLGTSFSFSAEYHVSDETGLRQTIQDIVDGVIDDPNPVIILDNDIDVSATPFPSLNQQLTINTNGNTLAGINTASGSTPGASITFSPANGSLTIEGALRGGNSAPDGGPIVGGIGLLGLGITITNEGSITGGNGSDRPSNLTGGTGGTGLEIVNGTLLNNGTITGGTGGNSESGPDGLAGVGALIQNGTAHVNNGTIQAGMSTRAGGGSHGLELHGTLTNNGSILGNGLASDAGTNADGIYLYGTIINNSTGLIRGADASGVSGQAGDGITARSGGGTVINYGTIRAGASANNPAVGAYGIVAQPGNPFTTLTIINGGTIEGDGLPTTDNLAISFNSTRGILELHAGSNIVGNVQAGLGITDDILRLGGDGDETFNVSAVGTGSSFKYRGFNIFEKTGASNWTITGVGAGQAADWTIIGGRLTMSNGSDLGNGILTVTAGTLAGSGTVGQTNVAANGIVAPGINGIGTLTINGDYTGNGGTLQIETALGGDSSQTDLLQISGNSTGSTSVMVTNLGGAGAQTTEGIRIVKVDGEDSSGTFTLIGDYVYEGDQAVVAGAYAYRLYQGSISSPEDGDWYLRSVYDEGQLFQAGVPVYEAYPTVLQSFNQLSTLQQRLGNRSWMVVAQGADAISEHANATPGVGIWTEFDGGYGEFNPETSTTATTYDVTIWRMKAGIDALLSGTDNGQLIAGLSLHYGTVSSDVSSVFGSGSIDATGYGATGTLTWYGTNGIYADAQAQMIHYDSDLTSDAGVGLIHGNGGFGYALGVELGQRIAVSPEWAITPQAQLIWSSVDFDDFTDAFGAQVSLDSGNSLIGRLGLAVDRQTEWLATDGSTSRSHLYGIGNLYYDFEEGTAVTVAETLVDSELSALWGGIGIGGTYSWSDDRYGLYGEALAKTQLEDFGDSYVLNGKAGFRLIW